MVGKMHRRSFLKGSLGALAAGQGASLLEARGPETASVIAKGFAAAPAVSRRLPRMVASPPRLTTIAEMVQAPDHDLAWLLDALQIAIQIELATLPPYLAAYWTIRDSSDPVAASVMEVSSEEMLHFGLACNLLSAIDGTPLIADSSVVPNFPCPLPGGVRPGLIVSLRKLDKEQAQIFMEIEYPQAGLITAVAAPPVTIGEFYGSILAAFKDLNPTLSTQLQIDQSFEFGELFKVDSLSAVERAIELVKLQGEGSNTSPEEASGDLAHYYRFGEIHHEKKYVKDVAGNWGYNGENFPIPDVHPMADIPAGGYRQGDVPDPTVWELIQRFDHQYSEMLRLLQMAWTNDGAILEFAVHQMLAMGATGRELVTIPRPDGRGNYGPCFRYVAAV